MSTHAITLTTPAGVPPLYFRIGAADLQTYVIAAIFVCKNEKCKDSFNTAEEAISHGICPECLEKEAEKATRQ